MKVYTVWSESGEYEQYSNDLRGVFVTSELAEQHAAQLAAREPDSDVRTETVDVLDTLPVFLPRYEQSAHFNPDGSEHPGLGHRKFGKSSWTVWDHECLPVEGRLSDWNGKGEGDFYVEVHGTDPDAVRAEFRRLAEEGRKAQNTGDSSK